MLLLVLFSFFISMYYAPSQVGGFITNTMPIDTVVARAVISAFFLVFFLVSIRKDNSNNFNWALLFSPLTYSVFLIHAGMGRLFFDYIVQYTNKYTSLFLTILLVLSLAALIHHFIERRFSGRLKRLLTTLLQIKAASRSGLHS